MTVKLLLCGGCVSLDSRENGKLVTQKVCENGAFNPIAKTTAVLIPLEEMDEFRSLLLKLSSFILNSTG